MTVQHLATWAAAAPDRPAVITQDSVGFRTYAELEARSNRLAQHFRSIGLHTGDHVAVLVENRTEFLEITWAALRTGLYLTPINWHLAEAEAAYIVDDCGASVLIGSSTFAPLLRELDTPARHGRSIVVGEPVAGYVDYEEALAAQPPTPVDDGCEGMWMFYSSGTTGRPKGIKPPGIGGPLGAPTSFVGLAGGLYGIGEDSVYLSPAPLYHAAPSGWTNAVHRLGGTVVLMEQFDAEEALRLIEAHRVTHVQFVPTHFVRMLKLPPEVRARYDLSSLRTVIHAAAPCPPQVKWDMLEWFGPIVYEFYSGSEGVGFCAISPQEWIEHPGSVGRSLMGAAHVLDDDGVELPAGEHGQIWFESPGRFEYHGDAEKTAAAFNDRGWSSLGDMGTLDADGYLYLTDRVSNMIISGGVNIYPREVEDVLVLHEGVVDVAVVAVPDPDMGEAVRALVQPITTPTDPVAFEAALIGYCHERLSHFKCPRSVVFVDELPRLPTGKLAKRMLPPELLAP